MTFLIQLLMVTTSLFLIVLVLLQRGRGGGLAGALGGMGGQSAFGSKAGDVFTRITAGVAIVWFLLYVGGSKYLNTSTTLFGSSLGGAAAPAQETIQRQPTKQKQKSSPAGPSGTKPTPSGPTPGGQK